MDQEDPRNRCDPEMDEFHPKATRTLFVGNLEKVGSRMLTESLKLLVEFAFVGDWIRRFGRQTRGCDGKTRVFLSVELAISVVDQYLNTPDSRYNVIPGTEQFCTL